MLRQGQPVSDLLVFTGEDVPNLLGFRNDQVSPVPAGYDFDGCDWETLNAARVEDGTIVLPSGTRYRLLIMPESPEVRLRVAKKVLALVEDGATILSPKFSGSPSRVKTLFRAMTTCLPNSYFVPSSSFFVVILKERMTTVLPS